MDVTVVGSCNMDLLSYIPHLPSRGQTIHGSKFKTGFGGKGANQCTMSAFLGAKTAMVAKVGNDSYGTGFKSEFVKHGINTDYVFETAESATGVAPCLVDEDGGSAIIIISGANLLLTPAEVRLALPVIAQSKVVVCQLEVTEEATMEALRIAKENGATTIFNPAPRKPDLNEEVFKYCDVFCPNETEAADIPMQSIDDAGTHALRYLSLGCKVVIITLGDQGVVYLTADDPKPVHVQCPRVNVKDSTGAGDSFVGSLAYFIACMSQLSWFEKIRRSVYIASDSVTREGTQTSYPKRQQLPEDLFTD